MLESLKLVSSAKCFGGLQNVYSFFSKELQCETRFSAYIPPSASKEKPVPVLYWLSGLTCTEENFIIKSGFQKYAAQQNLLVIGPDTSPRGCQIEGEDADWDFGTGAGFYVDATTEGYKDHYRMYSYVVHELPEVVEQNFPVLKGVRGISGHSMGGHGALICALKNPGFYKSVTAFAPISNPSVSPWGIKCFKGYLGDKPEEWKQWDATELIAKYKGPELHLRIDQVCLFTSTRLHQFTILFLHLFRALQTIIGIT